MNDLYIGKDEVVVSLDHSEVRLVMRALDVLRYSADSYRMSGSQLVNLAGLSGEWLRLTQDVGGKRFTPTDFKALEKASDRCLETIWRDNSVSWEIY